MALLIAMVFVLTGALIYVWKIFPHTPAYVPPKIATSTIPVVPAIPGTTSTPATPAPDCGNHGHWNGTDCLCGGIAGWSCPADQECGDLKPTPATPDALGTCHAKPVTVREAPAGMICDAANSICVNSSYQNMRLQNLTMVTGTYAGYSRGLSFTLSSPDKQTAPYSQGGFTDLADVNDGEFSLPFILVNKPFDATSSILEIKSEKEKLELPVQIPSEWMTVKLFAYGVNQQKIGADATICNEFVPSEVTVPKSPKVIAAAVNALLHFTNQPDGPAPRFTFIPQGTQLLSATLSGTTLKLQFSKELENYGGGSCNVESIRTQIEKTAMQFGNVNKVEISVPGKTPEETLQP